LVFKIQEFFIKVGFPISHTSVWNSCSQEDKDIVFCTKDECTSFEDHWPQQIASHDHPCQDRHNSTQADQEKPSRFRDCPTQTSGLPLSQSQKVNKAVGSRITSTPKKATVKPRHIFTGRLLAPTHTSRAKMSVTEPMEKKVNKGKSFAPLSDKEVLQIAALVYMSTVVLFFNVSICRLHILKFPADNVHPC
jgi:hypothetical protein